jgi:hypothetical protein
MSMYADKDDQQQPTPPLVVSEDDEELLTEIRDTYTDFSMRWKDIKDERNIDLQYICGDPWSIEDRKQRKADGRPCISHDELSQYVNSCVNSVRQNKRGMKVEPRGGTATEKTAEDRQNHIRAIEYESKAPDIYLGAFQELVEGSYSFFRVGSAYASDDAACMDASIFDQKITIKPIANPNCVLFDPDCREPDWSDGERCFVVEPMTRADFKRKWKRAQITDFTPDHMMLAKDWIQDKNVLVAEFWKVLKTESHKYELEDGRVVNTLGKGEKPVNERVVVTRKVMQYMTNGVEILERNVFPGKHLGIIPMIGLQRWVEEGGIVKRKLFSLVRLARDPQLSLAFLVSQQMEEAGLTPKTPWVGYVGQFETDKEAWENSTKVPTSMLQIDVVVDGASGQILPPPQHPQFTPNFQAYEVAKDSCRRAIQAAMGITPLPTAAQRDSEKSGVALEKIKQQGDIGSFHFVDGFDRALSLCGRIVDSQIPVRYDTERKESLRKADDSRMMVTFNTEEPYPNEKGEMVHYKVDPDADHDVTVSDGPSQASQYEAAAEFVDSLLAALPTLPIAPPQAQKILALAIQMKELGPKGDQIAEIISPANPDQSTQMQQQIGHAQQQMAAQGQALQELQGELQKLRLEKAGHVIDNEYKASMQRMEIEAKVAAAEIATKSQQLDERMTFVTDIWQKLQDQAHEAGLQASDQQHDRTQADAAAQAAQAQQQQAAAQEPAPVQA